MLRKYRVVQWGMGHVGTAAMRMMLQKQSIEVVGAIVSRKEKAGRDIGALAGRKDLGILASDNPAEVLGTEADAVLLATTASVMSEGSWDKNVKQITKIN